MKTNISLILILCLLLGACKNGNASSQSKSETPQDTIKAIKMPAIPQMMTAPEQRADFLAKHYWDNVNFADTFLSTLVRSITLRMACWAVSSGTWFSKSQ